MEAAPEGLEPRRRGSSRSFLWTLRVPTAASIAPAQAASFDESDLQKYRR